MKIHRRRIYILPTRFGFMLAALLAAMLIAGLNYNSNLGLAFAFFMASIALVAMHHCHRNLLGLSRGREPPRPTRSRARDAAFDFMLRNESALDRCDVEIRCSAASRAGRARSVAIGRLRGS